MGKGTQHRSARRGVEALPITAVRHRPRHGHHQRRGIHLDALAEGRAGLTENVDALVRAIDVDDRAYALCLDWAGGPHAYPADHERLVPGIEALVCEGVRPGELHPGLEKLLEDHRARTERAPARDGDHDHDRGTRRRRR